MNEEFYSIGRGSLNINGKFYYGLDFKITDFMRSLNQENQQLKENNLAMQEEMARTWAKLQQKEDVINKAKVDLEKHLNAKSYSNHKYELFDRKYLEEVLEILNSKGSNNE